LDFQRCFLNQSVGIFVTPFVNDVLSLARVFEIDVRDWCKEYFVQRVFVCLMYREIVSYPCRVGKWFGQPKAWWTRYRDAGPMVLVEDALSSYKVAKAIEHYAPESAVSVLATLGTTVVPGLIPVLAGRDIICMYDGDRAGADGASSVRRRMAVFGGKFVEARPESGDPKDMTLENLYERIKGNLPRRPAGT
jgi:hypothetical protein